jgi:RNA polymerase sigma-70 factor (ECF subfamily)
MYAIDCARLVGDEGPMTDFQAIYERYARDVYRFALYLCGDPTLAEDIASETFVRLWAADEPVRMQTVKAYLFAIVRHLCIDQQRAGKRRVEIDPELPEPGLSPEMRAHYKSELRAVLKLLQDLPEVDRAAILMRAQHGMPYEEIARVLNVSVATVKVKIHRTRLKLAAARKCASPDEQSIEGVQ